MDLAEDEGDDNSQQERSQGQGRTLSSLPRGERLELEPGGASGGAEEGPPEVKPDHRRCILHFDIDCFYAQVEEVLDPSLRGKPVGIRQKYLMVTCNYAARRLGARKMESVIEAKRRCPGLIVLDGEDLTRYREASEAIFSYVTAVCGPMVQRLGMDEIFADITEVVHRGRSAVEGVAIVGNAHTTAPDVLFPPLWPGDDAATAATGATAEQHDEASAAAAVVATAAALQSRLPAPCPGITGHLYSPGSGGTLLEAQTGLEVSLHDGSGSGSGNSGGGNVFGVDGSAERSQAGSSSGTATLNTPSSTERGDRNADSPFDALSEKDRPDWEDPEVTPGASQRQGKGATGSQSNSLGSGANTSAGARYEEDARSSSARGECRCGCFDRLSIASAFAERVRRGLLKVVGYTCSAGIGCSKAAAKLAGELHKPYQQTTILPEHAMSMMAQLPLRKLPGCGYSTCAKIKAELGITETRKLRDSPWPLLVRAVGVKLAKVLFLLCRGEDPTPVVPSVRPKTMSDEDSFKRGTIRSRAQVERHVRRLASPLLLRARDRARLHKEAPDALRFGLRRASKGHGTRVSRQCAVSSWVVTAVGGTATSTPATAAAVRAVGAETEGLPKRPNEVDSGAGSGGAPPVTGADTVLGVPNGSASSAGGGRAAEGHEAAKEGLGVQDIEGGFREARPGAPTRKRSPEATGRNPAAEDGSPFSSGYSAASPTHPPPSPLGHGDEALSEVVRLAMTMFDKICSPGEKLDLTLLTVGFAGFRSLGGGAQSGMARYLEASQKLRQARDGERADGNNHHAISAGTKKASSGPIRRGSLSASNTSTFTPHTGYSNDSLAPTLRAANHSVPAVVEGAGGAAAELVGAVGAARQDSPIDISTKPKIDASGAERAKRPRVQGNPYPPRHQRRPRRPHEGASVLAGHTGDGGEDAAGGGGSGMRQGGGGVDWEEAEILVVGDGGQAVPGRGRLDWCGMCRAHVLRADMQEHASSDFHQSRLHSAQP